MSDADIRHSVRRQALFRHELKGLRAQYGWEPAAEFETAAWRDGATEGAISSHGANVGRAPDVKMSAHAGWRVF